jgi:aminodeoxyfutalosine deaminase
MHDAPLATSFANRHVVLENCISSNICTGALAKQTGKPVASVGDHPLAKLMAQGSLVTLSTDDPAMFHTDLLTEYSLAASLGLSQAQLLQLAEQSFSASFLPPIEKRQMLENFRAATKSAGLV